jgi:hypothetical protein
VYGDGRSGSGQRKGLDEGAAAHGFSLQSIYMEAPALPGIYGSAAMERRMAREPHRAWKGASSSGANGRCTQTGDARKGWAALEPWILLCVIGCSQPSIDREARKVARKVNAGQDGTWRGNSVHSPRIALVRATRLPGMKQGEAENELGPEMIEIWKRRGERLSQSRAETNDSGGVA